MRVINERKNLIDFILNFAQDEYSTKEDLYNLSIETIEQLQIRVKQIKEYYNNTDKIHINNSDYMEFISDIATQMTEIAYKGKATIEIQVQSGLSDGVAIVFTDEAQEYFNDKYDEVEGMINKTLKVYSNE